MPRPKGSKNKVKSAVTTTEDIDAQIADKEFEVERLAAELKAAKAELKKLEKEKVKAEAAALAAKAEEDKKAIMDALEKSGKSIEEILEMLGK